MIESTYKSTYNPLQFAIYTKSMKLFELYSKEKANFFLKGTVMQIIWKQIYDRFNTNNKHWNLRIHSCSGF